MSAPKPLWGNKSSQPALESEESAEPPPQPLWGQKKKPPEPEEADDSPPPKPLWGAKKSDTGLAAVDEDAAQSADAPPKPLWGAKKSSSIAKESESDSPPPKAGASPKKKRGGSANRGSVMARNAVAKAIGRNKAQSVVVDVQASGEMITLLKTDECEYELGNTLGTGAYATVRVCKNAATGEIFAVKVFQKSFLKRRRFSSGEWKTNLDGVHREIAIMKQIKHPHVMTLHDVTASDNHLYMVMDYCPRGAIMETENLPCEPLALKDARRWFAETVLGLEYLHFQSVVHHDLKPDNILVNMRGAAVISDFGVSRARDYNEAQNPTLDRKSSASEAKGAAGTPLYNAPEKFDSNDYDGTLADVWALGVTLHAMVFGELPFPAAQFSTPEALEAAVKGEGEWKLGSACDDVSLVALLEGMMTRDPTRRHTLEQVHNADWDAAWIAVEEDTAGGGGPRASWKKISVTDQEVGTAVKKGVNINRRSTHVGKASSAPAIAEAAKHKSNGGCWPRFGKSKRASKDAFNGV